MAPNYPSYFFDSRTDSPRQRLAEVLASPNVAGGGSGGVVSSAGAVRQNAQGATLGDGFAALIGNFQKARQFNKEQDDAKKLKAETLAARTEYLVSKGIEPEKAAMFAADPAAFGQVAEDVTKPAAKAETQTINNVLYERQADGGWKPVIDGGTEKTTTQKDYDAAKAAGYAGSFFDYQKELKGGTTINTGDGLKLTESQSKDVGFYSRGRYADEELKGLDEKLTSFGETAGARAPVIGNYLKTPEFRQAERAGRDFLAVILRKDTGAAVTDHEFDMYGDIFLPSPGDDVQTLENKRSARSRALTAIRSGLGTASPIADDFDSSFDENFRKTAPKKIEGKPETATDKPTQSKVPVYNPATGDFE